MLACLCVRACVHCQSLLQHCQSPALLRAKPTPRACSPAKCAYHRDAALPGASSARLVQTAMHAQRAGHRDAAAGAGAAAWRGCKLLPIAMRAPRPHHPSPPLSPAAAASDAGEVPQACRPAGCAAGTRALGSQTPRACTAGNAPVAADARGGKKKDSMPFQQRVLNGVLGVSNVPYRCGLRGLPAWVCALAFCNQHRSTVARCPCSVPHHAAGVQLLRARACHLPAPRGRKNQAGEAGRARGSQRGCKPHVMLRSTNWCCPPLPAALAAVACGAVLHDRALHARAADRHCLHHRPDHGPGVPAPPVAVPGACSAGTLHAACTKAMQALAGLDWAHPARGPGRLPLP